MDRARRFVAVGAVAVAGSVLTAQAPATPLTPAAQITLAAPITSLAVLNGSSTIVAGLADGQVVVWSGRDTVATVTMKPHTGRVLAVGTDASGRGIWSLADNGSLARSTMEKGTPTVKRLDIGAAPVTAAAFSPDGAKLATGGARGEIRVFDTADGTVTQKIQGHRTELHAVALRQGPAILASASAEADLRVWDMATGRTVGSVDSDLAFLTLAFSPRDGTLASGGTGRRLTLHDPTTFKAIATLALPRPLMVGTLAWSPDGSRIGIGDVDDETLGKGGIQVVDAASRSVLADLDTGRTPASAIVFAANDVLVGAVGRELRAWQITLPPAATGRGRTAGIGESLR